MKFTVKDMDIATGSVLVAILNKKDAIKLDLRAGDRVLVTYRKRNTVAILDISEGKKAVPEGKVGLFEDVLDKLRINGGKHVDVSLTSKPKSVKHIRDKLNGKTLSCLELCHIMDDISNDRLSAVEKAYFVSAGYLNGFTKREIVDMTKAMVVTGDQLHFKQFTLDKHCIGGVPGNRTTMVVVPIVTAAGLHMPKTSSRAITSPAGTADTMEVLARVELCEKKVTKLMKKVKGFIIWGGTMNLAPADDKIIEVEHPLSIDAEGQLLASVMAKKASVSSNAVLIDIPMGKQVKVKTMKQAKHLKKMFEMVGKSIDMNVRVIITDGSQPIGNGIGPVLEAEDVLRVLKNEPNAPDDLREKCLRMSGILLEMGGFKNGYRKAQELLSSGAAYMQMRRMIQAQGRQKITKVGEFSKDVTSGKSGKVKEIDNEIIAKIARIAGCPKDKGAGLYLYKHVKDKVKKGEKLFTVYAESEERLKYTVDFLRKNKGFLVK
ncbi:MAG: thymidine phosphorylase [Nanoarchaeota archaeon]|nr:thymidine phosphorylase [Nanoarchaeota archaeon]|tara:strand:- start:2145 stop:3614 length:1470 start_codon:yes stop_codon:yes gene_type:complete